MTNRWEGPGLQCGLRLDLQISAHACCVLTQKGQKVGVWAPDSDRSGCLGSAADDICFS